ncbi:MAG: glycogen-binding domain-containing protein [Leptospiraceae bacterium]|nr:glycogen-binding domain-containing protein [Leptospiraceae bacterium]MBK7054353.1 glycogen-binding domain-containing protein [Leptospiraceae bacterium]MBK9498725.1 glycogen-binding domain-containing protein [Leptospiraceae bacterium]MBL0262592.1 glycogen-binding domain-containing protein [Leptospiraceae bacterium]
MPESKKKKIKIIQRKPSRKKYLLLFLFLSLFGFGVIGQDTVDWVGSYSSKELEGTEEKVTNNKIYFYWQIASLKRAIPPRYIKMIDIDAYAKRGQFLNSGILFTYNGLKNSDVSICGNFSSWRCIPMTKNKFGVFHALIPANFKNRKEEAVVSYEYKFKVDNLFDFDVENSNRHSDGAGSYYSEYLLENFDFEKHISARVISDEMTEDLDFITVEFQIYKPNASVISLVGNFNQWNPEHDYLQKDRNGIFKLRKKLRPGEYLYNYIVDGEKILDTYNSETRHRVETDELSSYLKVIDNKFSSL